MPKVTEQLRTSVRAEGMLLVTNAQLIKVLPNDRSAILIAEDLTNAILPANSRDLTAGPLEANRNFFGPRPTLDTVDYNGTVGWSGAGPREQNRSVEIPDRQRQRG